MDTFDLNTILFKNELNMCACIFVLAVNGGIYAQYNRRNLSRPVSDVVSIFSAKNLFGLDIAVCIDTFVMILGILS